MRIAFMGTPEFALPALERLLSDGHAIAAVYSQPPRPAGRGKAMLPTPVARRAAELGLDVKTPDNFKHADTVAEFASLRIEMAVVAAYGLILPQAVLDVPPLGCINIHASLLPRWRGAAPVQRAILAGDRETGVTIMMMAAGLDTGPMLLSRSTPIDRKTAGELTDELAVMGAALISEVVAAPDHYPPQPQPGIGVTYAAKLDKAEARLDFSTDALQVEQQVRAFNPWPGSFFELDGERIRVLSAEIVDAAGAVATVLDDRLTIGCGTGAIRPLIVQRAGRAAMTVDALLRGYAITAGTRLS